jgi:RNA polymerase sigma-70 factor (ECF subfamily)
MTVDLVVRAQGGDHEAFDELVDRFGPELYRLAVAVIGPVAAADVTQEALIRVWSELPTLRDPDRFPAWARRILVNRCRDAARASRRRASPVAIDLVARQQPVTIPDLAVAVERSSDLRTAIATLTVEQRTVIALHYAFGLTIREVADTLGVPVGTAKSRLSAAIAALRRQLERDR